jgi:hypothetical protein
MSDFDLDLLELMTAIIGSVTAIAAVAATVIQYKVVKLELRKKQQDLTAPETPHHSKQPTDGKPTQ